MIFGQKNLLQPEDGSGQDARNNPKPLESPMLASYMASGEQAMTDSM